MVAMTVDELITALQKLSAEGHGAAEARVWGWSEVADPDGTDSVDGPYDIRPGRVMIA